MSRARFLYQNTLGYFFSIYCVFKVISSAWSIIFSTTSQIDFVTRALITSTTYFQLDIDITVWSSILSFVLVGIMSIMSVRGILIQLSKISFLLPTSLSSPPLILFLIHVMGLYFQSFIVMLRMNLPVQKREVMTLVFGDIDFGFYNQWFNLFFLLSAGVSMCFLYIVSKMKSMG